jgi:hypothetical protein
MWFEPAGGRKTRGDKSAAPAARDEIYKIQTRRSVSNATAISKMASFFRMPFREIGFVFSTAREAPTNPKWLRLCKPDTRLQAAFPTSSKLE